MGPARSLHLYAVGNADTLIERASTLPGVNAGESGLVMRSSRVENMEGSLHRPHASPSV